MNLNEALTKPGARDAIIKLANAMLKKAGSNAVTQFNESVPILSQPTEEKVSGSGISGTAQQANQSVPEMVDQAPPASMMPEDPYAAVPMEVDPASEGAAAAQVFLGPIMDMALQGDPNAQAIIAQTATQIAREAAMNAAPPMEDPNAMMMQEDPNAAAMVDQNGNPVQVDAQGNPVVAASPEAQVADQIVPDVGAQGSQPPVGEESGKEKKNPNDKKGTQTDSDKDAKKLASLSINQLSAIINLARMGEI